MSVHSGCRRGLARGVERIPFRGVGVALDRPINLLNARTH